MSTTTLHQRLHASGSVGASARRVPLVRIIAVELRKMFDTRSGFWLIASLGITTVLATAGVIAFGDDQDRTYSSFATAIRFPVAVLLPIIAILAVTSEWTQRSGLTTFTQLPARGRVILAKFTASVAVGVASMALTFAAGALGNIVSGTLTGNTLVWNVTLTQALYFVLGNISSLLIGFMLGVLIRSSTGAVVAYFIYTFLVPVLFGLLADATSWFRNAQPWVDIQFAQTPLFLFDGVMTGQQWAHIGVTGAVWLFLPLLVELRLVVRAEVK
jgi:ABC-type transport system involved in multi-copper enzyme maturation permease subunit